MKKYTKPSLIVESIELKEQIANGAEASVLPGDDWWDLAQ